MTNPNGRFGIHGGQYIPETLMNAVIELEEAYNNYKNDPEFNRELTELLNEYAGRPSRLYYAEKMTKDLGGAKIYLKREDLNHTGAHKINNVLGQALLAKKMGKTRLIAETGAGQHGVATATAAALMGMECVVFMGEEDTVRQALNVYRMRLLGADVIPVKTGTATLKDAVSEAMREWTSRISDTHYCLGSVMGPHPFPTIVRDFQAVISKEIKDQMLVKEGRLPDAVIACVGGGSNAIGSFYHFIEDENVRLIGCEAAGNVVFSVAGSVGDGAASKAKEEGKLAIQVDANKDDQQPGYILTSVIKNTEVPVYEIVKEAVAGKITEMDRVQSYSLASGAASITDLSEISKHVQESGKAKWEEIKTELADIEKKIGDGSIQVTNAQSGEKFDPAKCPNVTIK